MNHQSKLPLKTTKKEKDTHGFGILSMKKVIYDHDGYMKVNVYKNQFFFHIKISLLFFIAFIFILLFSNSKYLN